jgi:hypothetical protein
MTGNKGETRRTNISLVKKIRDVNGIMDMMTVPYQNYLIKFLIMEEATVISFL